MKFISAYFSFVNAKCISQTHVQWKITVPVVYNNQTENKRVTVVLACYTTVHYTSAQLDNAHELNYCLLNILLQMTLEYVPEGWPLLGRTPVYYIFFPSQKKCMIFK